MALSLKSKEGRSILTSLASNSSQAINLSPEAGRNLVGALGFRLVSYVRQIFQAPSAYQEWLNQQRNRVAQEFIAICKQEASSEAEKESRLSLEGKALHKNSELSQSSLDKLRSQSAKSDRPRVFTPSEFESLLTPSLAVSRHIHSSGLQRLVNFLNPFDQDGKQEDDWLSKFRSSGQALKIEMSESLEAYYDLLQSAWNPEDKTAWVSIGAHLMQLNDDLSHLCQAAEELVLSGHAKEAGFNLSLIFALLKGLTGERAILTYLIAHPHLVQQAKNWDQAIAKVRAN